MQMRFRGRRDVVADGNVPHQLTILFMPDGNRVAVLLDGRMLFDILNALVRVAVEPSVVCANDCVNLHLARAAWMNGDISGAGVYIEIHRAVYRKRLVKMAFLRGSRRSRSRRAQKRQRQHRAQQLQALHHLPSPRSKIAARLNRSAFKCLNEIRKEPPNCSDATRAKW